MIRWPSLIICFKCRKICDDPVVAYCRLRHLFCKACISGHIARTGRPECPECHQMLLIRDPEVPIDEYNTYEIDGNVLVERHRKYHLFIRKLRIRCDYVWNGCSEVIQLQHSAQHKATCPHRNCKLCGQWVSPTREGHDCQQNIIQRNKELEEMVKHFETEIQGLKRKDREWEEQHQRYDRYCHQIVNSGKKFKRKYNESVRESRELRTLSQTLESVLMDRDSKAKELAESVEYYRNKYVNELNKCERNEEVVQELENRLNEWEVKCQTLADEKMELQRKVEELDDCVVVFQTDLAHH